MNYEVFHSDYWGQELFLAWCQLPVLFTLILPVDSFPTLGSFLTSVLRTLLGENPVRIPRALPLCSSLFSGSLLCKVQPSGPSALPDPFPQLRTAARLRLGSSSLRCGLEISPVSSILEAILLQTSFVSHL